MKLWKIRGRRSRSLFWWGLISALNFSCLSVDQILQAGSCGAPNFSPAQNIDMTAPGFPNPGPRFVGVGDFNGDGKLDLAVPDRLINTISILLGNGDGTFQRPVMYNAGPGSRAVAIGDFNGDGKLDLATSNDDAGTVAVLLGNGDGTFQAPVIYNTGAGSRYIATADLNHDGKLDLVVVNDVANTISILLGKGDGIQPAMNLAAGTGPRSVAIGDFNGDGKLDLAVANETSNNVSILLGNGDGTFQPPVNFTAGTGVLTIATADLNGDGKLDLAIGNDTSNNVSIFFGRGDGTFQFSANYPVQAFPHSIAIADYNGDGKLDLAVSHRDFAGVVVLLGKGDGTFQPGVSFAVGMGPESVAAGDFNGDGRPDLATANRFSNTVSILMNNCGACPNISLTPTTLPGGSVGVAYNQVITANGGTAPYSFAFTGGTNPPPGLTVSSSGNVLSLAGTPTTAGTFNFTISATDANSCSAIQSYTVTNANISLNLSLSGGGANTVLTRGSTGPVQAGYAALSVNSGSAPYGTAVFSFTPGGIVLSEVGVPASPPTTKGRIFIDYRTGVPSKSDPFEAASLDINTGLALVNRGSVTANIIYTLRDKTGQNPVLGHGTLPAGAHRAKFINQLVDLAPDFALPGSFSTTTQFGSLEIQSDQSLSLLALRLTTTPRGDTLLTSTPIADLTQPLSTAPLFFAQLVDGNGFHTVIILLNTAATPETGKLQLFKDDGTPLVVQQVNGPAGSTFNYSIPPGGVYLLQTDGSPATVRAGSVQLTPDAGTSTPVGAGIFSLNQGGILVTESGIPSAAPTTHARIYIDESNGHDTGLAIAAPSATPLNLTVTAFQADGVTPAGASLGPVALNGNGHTAKFIGQLIAGLPPGFTGVLDLSSPSPFVALTLRSLTNTRGDFLLTTFPIADFTQAAPTPILFPQIADGGGFRTQFILLSAGGAASTTLNFFGDDGSALAVGKATREEKHEDP